MDHPLVLAAATGRTTNHHRHNKGDGGGLRKNRGLLRLANATAATTKGPRTSEMAPNAHGIATDIFSWAYLVVLVAAATMAFWISFRLWFLPKPKATIRGTKNPSSGAAPIEENEEGSSTHDGSEEESTASDSGSSFCDCGYCGDPAPEDYNNKSDKEETTEEERPGLSKIDGTPLRSTTAGGHFSEPRRLSCQQLPSGILEYRVPMKGPSLSKEIPYPTTKTTNPVPRGILRRASYDNTDDDDETIDEERPGLFKNDGKPLRLFSDGMLDYTLPLKGPSPFKESSYPTTKMARTWAGSMQLETPKHCCGEELVDEAGGRSSPAPRFRRLDKTIPVPPRSSERARDAGGWSDSFHPCAKSALTETHPAALRKSSRRSSLSDIETRPAASCGVCRRTSLSEIPSPSFARARAPAGSILRTSKHYYRGEEPKAGAATGRRPSSKPKPICRRRSLS